MASWLDGLNNLLRIGGNVTSALSPISASGGNINLGGLQLPRSLLGGGLLAAGAAQPEPGQIGEARQFLRNQFTSPTATGELQARSVTGAQTALVPLLGNVGPTGPGQNYLTKLFEDPNALATGFSGQLDAINSQFKPLLDQQRQRDIGDISQRFAAAFPAQVGAQGSEFGTLSQYITDQALPREQAFMGQLGLNLLGQKQNAANTVFQDEANRRNTVGIWANNAMDIPINAAGKILETNPKNQLSDLLSTLGAGALLGGQGGTTLLDQNGRPLGQVDLRTGQLSGQPNGQLNPTQFAQALLTPGNMGQIGSYILQSGGINSPLAQSIAQALGSQLTLDTAQAGQGLSGVMVQTSHGVAVPIESVNAQGLQTGAQAGGLDFGVKGAGLLGPAGTGSGMALASAAGSAIGGGAVGMKVGQAVSDWLEKPGQSNDFTTGLAGGASGAASGAAAGFAIGGPPGAVIGAIVGGLAGGFKGIGAENRREDAQKAQEQAQTDAARPAILQASQQAVAQIDTIAPQLESMNTSYQTFMQTLLAAGDPGALALDQQLRAAIQPITGWGANTPGQAAKEILFAVSSGLRSIKDNLTSSAGGADALTAYLKSGETGKFGPGVDIAQRKMSQATQLTQLAQQALDFARSRGFQHG